MGIITKQYIQTHKKQIEKAILSWKIGAFFVLVVASLNDDHLYESWDFLLDKDNTF